MVGIGIEGDYEDLQPLVDEYGADATEIFFPFPRRLAPGAARGTGQLLIVFTPAGLGRVTSKKNGPGHGAASFLPQPQVHPVGATRR